MKKILSILICFLLFISCMPAFTEAASQGSIQSGNYSYTVLDDKTAMITWYSGKENTLTIPEKIDGITVTAIDSAFWWNSDITNITIPDSITISKKVNPFLKCKKLKQVIVSPYHPTLATIDGVLFSKTDKCLLWYPITAVDKEYIIPDGIVSIADYAFAECKSLNSVKIPDSVSDIGENAFDNCVYLISVDIPKNLKNIGDSAFRNCDYLFSVTIPDSVVTVGKNPFFYSDKLKEIVVSENNPSLEVVNGALYSKLDKRLISVPNAYNIEEFDIQEGTEIIGDYAFAGCSNIRSINIPESVSQIGESAFLYCESLSNISIPDSITSIGNDAFRGCKNLKSVIVDPGSYAETYCIQHNKYVGILPDYFSLSYTYPNSNDWLNN